MAENPVPNPHRYRFVEFPIYNSLVYFTYILNGGMKEELARLVTVVISLFSIVLMYFVTKRYFSRSTAILASGLFAFLPYNIYYSRVVLPDPLLVLFSLGMIYFGDRWIWENKRWLYFTTIVFASGAFLIKPMAAFYLIPLVYSYYKKEGKLWPIPKRYWSLAFFSILPFALWRIRIEQHPEGIPASNWLFNGTHIRFKPAFWKWIVGDRFGREILGVAGTFLFMIGILLKPKEKEGMFLHLLGFASLLYLAVFATGNVQHDYYQILIVPALCIFVARGFFLLLEGIPGFLSRIWTIPLAILFLFLTIYLPLPQVQGLYQINNYSIVEAGQEANRILPQDAVVVAPYQGDTSFLYQTNRPGWAFVAYPIPDLINKFGVTDYVSVNKDDLTNLLMKQYSVLENNKDFVIIDLTKPTATSSAKIREGLK